MSTIVSRATTGSVSGTGTITTSTSSTSVTGASTSFTSQTSLVGKALFTTADVYIGTISSVTNDTTLVLTANAAVAISTAAYKIGYQPINSPLSNLQIDTNFINLNNEKVETADAVSTNTANKVVKRDSSGNFSAGTIAATFSGNLTGNVTGTVSGSAGSVVNAVTFNNTGSGAASGSTFNGSSAVTISYNSIGAQAAGTYVNAVTGTSPVASSGGTNPAISLATGYGDTQNPFASKTANYFLAAPNGSAGAPTFRAIVAADIPTLNQNTTGTAGNVTSISSAVGSTYTWTASQYFQSNLGTTLGSLSGPPLQAYATGTNSAFMSFHRSGAYAVNMGLDSDNVLRIGGWSASANRLQMDMSGNLTMAGNVTAYSDEKLKTNWRDLPADFVEQLALVKNGTYDRTDEEGLTQDGVSAQSLQKVLPNSVIQDKAGTLSVSYGNAAMVSAVEMAKRIVEQDKRIKALEEMLSKLLAE